MYATIRHSSGGYHGHQIKDYLGARTIMSLFDLNYLHTPYAYLGNFGLGYGHKNLSWIRRHFGFNRTIKLSGPYWDGMSSFEEAMEILGPVIEQNRHPKTLFVFENAMRIHPFQTIPWFNEGKIKKDVFSEIVNECSFAFDHGKIRHVPPMNENRSIKVAVHISRGVDFDQNRFPDHFGDSRNVRYMFPLTYFDRIIGKIRNLSDDVQFEVFTERLNSSEIVDFFAPQSDVNVVVGNNRREKNQPLIEGIFKTFVNADILVSCNSSFSTVATYFRNGRPSIYHPHKHLDFLPKPAFIATDTQGEFDFDQLKMAMDR